MQHDKYINEQLEYYRERASEYDEWFLRQGHYNYGEASTNAKRNLKDGREFEIVKLFYEPKSLSQCLQALGWQANVNQTQSFFLYGSLSK